MLKDAAGMLEWMHDPSCNVFFKKNMSKMTMEDVLRFISINGNAEESLGSRHYAVVNDNDIYLGTISLKNINMDSKDAEYAISLRGITRGTGVAETATMLLLKVAFQELGLEKVYLNVLAINERAIHFYQKIGFIEASSPTKNIEIDGKLVDLRWFALAREDCEFKELTK